MPGPLRLVSKECDGEGKSAMLARSDRSKVSNVSQAYWSSNGQREGLVCLEDFLTAAITENVDKEG